jgi:ribosomal subunit interface protein
MQLPLQITFRHMEPSPVFEAQIRERVAKLDEFFGRITSCHVVVDRQNHRHGQGNLFEVRIDVTLPGGEIVAGHDPGMNHAHEDAHVALRDAFDALRRRIEDYARKERGDVKHHNLPEPEATQR